MMFNCDGSLLAVGVGYGWEQGAEHAASSIGTARVFVREVGASEVKVRVVFGFSPLLAFLQLER